MIGAEHEARLLDLAGDLQRQRVQIIIRANGQGCRSVELVDTNGAPILAPVTIAQAQVEIALLQLSLHRDTARREVEQQYPSDLVEAVTAFLYDELGMGGASNARTILLLAEIDRLRA